MKTGDVEYATCDSLVKPYIVFLGFLNLCRLWSLWNSTDMF